MLLSMIPAPKKNCQFNSLCSLRITIARIIPYMGSRFITKLEANADKWLSTLSESEYAKVVQRRESIIRYTQSIFCGIKLNSDSKRKRKGKIAVRSRNALNNSIKEMVIESLI